MVTGCGGFMQRIEQSVMGVVVNSNISREVVWVPKKLVVLQKAPPPPLILPRYGGIWKIYFKAVAGMINGSEDWRSQLVMIAGPSCA